MRPGFGYTQRNILAVRSSIIGLVLLLSAVFFWWILSPVALAEESVKPEQIILTWTLDPATSQTITWLTPDNSPARVQYLRAGEFTGSFAAAQQDDAECSAFDSTNYRFTVNISGLLTDTKYVYRVGREEAWSGPLFFTTAADTQEFSFLYMGDVQSGYAEWGNMLNSVYQAYPQIKFALLGGDLTDNGDDENEWGQFLDAATGVFSRIPAMPSMGNHDGSMYLDFFALPANGPEGLKQEFYSFDYGNAHFVVLDSSNNTNEAVKQWLQDDLQDTTKKWKFVVFHIPAYPATYDYKEIDQSIRANWVPILEQNRVEMVFVGHQHQYMRTHPIYQGEVQTEPAYGIVYVMGNAGSKIYAGGGEFPYVARGQSGSNYQIIGIDGNVLTLTTKKATGELIESYTINKGIIAAPTLAADVTDNVVGQVCELTFTEDAAWRAAITCVRVDGVALPADQYTVSEGKLTIDANIFKQAKDYDIVVQAAGYQDVCVTQTIKTGPGPNPVYTLSPQPDSVYTAGTTPGGINTMTVKAGIEGFKYFTVSVTPVISQSGNETVVFSHLRNGAQLGLNSTKADFDQVNIAQAGFNVQQGDVIKAYILDDLTNAAGVNPVIFQ